MQEREQNARGAAAGRDRRIGGERHQWRSAVEGGRQAAARHRSTAEAAPHGRSACRAATARSSLRTAQRMPVRSLEQDRYGDYHDRQTEALTGMMSRAAIVPAPRPRPPAGRQSWCRRPMADFLASLGPACSIPAAGGDGNATDLRAGRADHQHSRRGGDAIDLPARSSLKAAPSRCAGSASPRSRCRRTRWA